MDFNKLLETANKNQKKAAKLVGKIHDVEDQRRRERELEEQRKRAQVEAVKKVLEAKKSAPSSSKPFQIPKVKTNDRPREEIAWKASQIPKRPSLYQRQNSAGPSSSGSQSGSSGSTKTSMTSARPHLSNTKPERPLTTKPSASSSCISETGSKLGLSDNLEAKQKEMRTKEKQKREEEKRRAEEEKRRKEEAAHKKTQKSSLSTSKKVPPSKPQLKRLAPPPVDFSLLMRQAEANSKGEKPVLEVKRLERSTPPDHGFKKPRMELPKEKCRERSYFEKGHDYQKNNESKSERPSSSCHRSSSKSSAPPKVSGLRRDPPKSQTTKPLAPALPLPTASSNGAPAKRYLPGDIRYNPGSKSAEKATLQATSSSSHRQFTRDRPIDHRSTELARNNPSTRKLSVEEERRRQREKLMRQRKLEKERRYEQMSLVERERARERRTQMRFIRGGESDSDEEDEDVEDEDFGSDLDDFIDDSGADEFSREEFEEVLSAVNKNYDVKKWKRNEAMIDERSMLSSVAEMQAEEARSYRLGLKEDIIEAKLGKSRKL